MFTYKFHMCISSTIDHTPLMKPVPARALDAVRALVAGRAVRQELFACRPWKGSCRRMAWVASHVVLEHSTLLLRGFSISQEQRRKKEERRPASAGAPRRWCSRSLPRAPRDAPRGSRGSPRRASPPKGRSSPSRGAPPANPGPSEPTPRSAPPGAWHHTASEALGGWREELGRPHQQASP